ASIEIHKTKCMVLKKSKTGERFKSKGDAASFAGYENGNYIVRNETIRKALLPFFAYALYYDGFLPFVDETGYSGTIDVSFPGSLNKLSDIRAALAGYDLILAEEDRNIPM